VHFETSCSEAAQRRFDRAMRYQHSFWYRESKELFEDVLCRSGPRHSLLGHCAEPANNPHAPPPAGTSAGPRRNREGQGRSAKTQRERDHRSARGVYTDHDKVDHRTRVAYLKAIEGVAQRYPNDDEAQILYGITLNVAAPPSDKTYAMQLKGAAILEPIFRRQPRIRVSRIT
jgi:hypothetical protein